MSFGDNLQFLRKQRNITQEELAERFGVSRQTVSKWESGGSFPETDKILQLCEEFGCSMDTLMRGDVAVACDGDRAAYDRHQNTFIAEICGGVASVLCGVTLLLALMGFGVPEALGVMAMLAMVVVAVMLFIVGGITHTQFVQRHPVHPVYTEREIERFDRRFPFWIAVPAALVLLGIIWLIGASELLPASLATEQWENFIVAIFMLIVTVSATAFVYAGMTKAKYTGTLATSGTSEPQHETKASRWSGAIMLLATAVFLSTGFLFGWWQYSWVVFPVGGILCGVVSCILGDKE